MSRPRLIQAFIILFILGQAIITLAESAIPGRKGYLWRMFATTTREITVELVDTSGTHRPLDWSAHAAFVVKGVDYWNLLPPHLCRVYPDTASVVMRRAPADYKEVPCP